MNSEGYLNTSASWSCKHNFISYIGIFIYNNVIDFYLLCLWYADHFSFQWAI